MPCNYATVTREAWSCRSRDVYFLLASSVQWPIQIMLEVQSMLQERHYRTQHIRLGCAAHSYNLTPQSHTWLQQYQLTL